MEWDSDAFQTIRRMHELSSDALSTPAPNRVDRSPALVNSLTAGAGCTVNITVYHHPPPQPIAGDQLAELTALVSKISQMEVGGGATIAHDHRVWSRLLDYLGVDFARAIPASDFRAARDFLNGWISRLGG